MITYRIKLLVYLGIISKNTNELIFYVIVEVVNIAMIAIRLIANFF